MARMIKTGNMFSRRMITLMLIVFIFFKINAQKPLDSTLVSKDPTKFRYSSLILPGALITIGIIGLESHTLKDVSAGINEERDEHIDDLITIDDFTQYAPVALTYGLDAFGVNAKHSFKDRTLVLATSYLVMSSTVLILKSTARVERPDGSSFNSFPSGHTATAFMGAEMLWQEYKHHSIWYGVLGYSLAITTGTFRVYNDRHWFNDVVMGAGIGILSTKIGYWLLPFMKNKVFKSKKENNVGYNGMVLPFFSTEGIGLSAVVRF